MEKDELNLYCPSCGFGFIHKIKIGGKVVGGSGGAAAGAALGAKIGIAAGPLGAIAGTIPGAILGGIFGSGAGGKLDNPQCPKCGAKFNLPENKKIAPREKLTVRTAIAVPEPASTQTRQQRKPNFIERLADEPDTFWEDCWIIAVVFIGAFIFILIN